MKAVNAKTILSTACAVAILPLFALAVITGAHANDLAQSGLDDLLLVGLAMGGAIASLVNGFGRRSARTYRARARVRSSVSAMNL